jgi:3-oxoacyl-[acyl-carrier protein] reductase
MIDSTEIKNKLVLLTGASGGSVALIPFPPSLPFPLTTGSIGGACAAQFAEAGAHLALTYSTNISSLQTLATSLQKLYPSLRVSFHQVDLALEESIEKLFEEVKGKHGAGIDILVSNAGYGMRISEIW